MKVSSNTAMKTSSRKSRQANRIAFASEWIHNEPNPNAVDKAFLARNLVQVTLPHSNPGDVPVWGRTNGNLTLTIKPDWSIDPCTGKPVCIGLPYGTIPRLLLFWITTESGRTFSVHSVARFDEAVWRRLCRREEFQTQSQRSVKKSAGGLQRQILQNPFQKPVHDGTLST